MNCFYFINIAVYNNILFKPCNILIILYKYFILCTQHFIELICDLSGDLVLKTELAR